MERTQRKPRKSEGRGEYGKAGRTGKGEKKEKEKYSEDKLHSTTHNTLLLFTYVQRLTVMATDILVIFFLFVI